jgi:hypothetical protein
MKKSWFAPSTTSTKRYERGNEVNEELAELMEWQARCSDLQTVNEQLRDERDLALREWREAKAVSELYWSRIVELEAALGKANSVTSRLRLHLQQGIEL